ncbi:MucBP domain-containing protein, partial [Paenibacillus marinisediminis]
MKKRLRIAINWLSIVSIILGLMPGTSSNAFANASQGDGLIWPNPGATNLSKTATPTGTPGEWLVTLKVEGKDIKQSSDVVLVIDKSGSMKDEKKEKRMTDAKNAAKKFVDELLKEGSLTRIAVVSFSDTASIESNFKGTSNTDKQSLKKAIDGISADGGTNIQSGLRQANSLLSSSSAKNKVIVLLSDGRPTYSYQATTATAYTWPENRYNFALKDFTSRLGDGKDFEINTGYYEGGPWWNPTWYPGYKIGDYRIKDHGIGTISEAKAIIDSKIGIYSVGLSVGNDADAVYVLKNSQNKGYYSGSSSDLESIYSELAGRIAFAASGAKVIDPMGEMFNLKLNGNTFDSSVYTVSQGKVTYDPVTETLSWDIGDISEKYPATLTYKVVMDQNHVPKPDPDVLYPTNKTTTLTYNNVNDKPISKDFVVPEVSYGKGSIKVWGYKVNADGVPINEAGNPVPIDRPDLAAKLYEHKFVNGGTDALTIGQTYSVPADQVPGHTLIVGDNPKSVALTMANPSPTVYFGYTEGVYNVTVDHKAGDTVLKAAVTEPKGQGVQLIYSNETFEGYDFSEVVITGNHALTINGGQVTGKMPGNDIHITFKYVGKDQSVKVKHMLQGTTTELIKPTSVAGKTGQQVTLNAANIPGYTAVDVTHPYTFTNKPDQEVTFYYTANPQIVTVKYMLDGTTTELKPSTSKDGKTGETVKLEAIDIDGYTKVAPTEVNYTFTAESNQEHIFYYTAKEQSVAVKYMLEGTKTELNPATSKSGKTGETVKLEAIDIDGYTKVAPTEVNYTFTAESNQEHIFYYTAKE